MAFESNFIFNVEINKPREIDISDDGQTTSPSETLTIGFIYKGGVGTGLATGFRIFIYDRGDTTDVGTPDSPEADSTAKPIPVPFGITPTVPLGGSPEITPTLIAGAMNNIIRTNDVYAELVSGQWNAFHKGSFQVTAPTDGYDANDELITFSGQAQITQ